MTPDSAAAGYVATGAKITRISNTDSNSAAFAVYVVGGSGPCAGGSWIIFPASAAPDSDTYKRAYAAALVALTAGMTVAIHNYANNNCDGASYIEIGGV